MPNYVMQTSFGGGEVSPSMYGRTDLAKYQVSCRKLLNFFPQPHGGASNRPGLRFINACKGNTAARVIPFQFSLTQAYVIELGELYARFYKDGGIIVKTAADTAAWVTGTAYKSYDYVKSATDVIYRCIADHTSGATTIPGGTGTWTTKWLADATYEIATPYTAAQLDEIKYVQSADTLFFVHPSLAPRTMTRTAHNAWTVSTYVNRNGPFAKENVTATTIAASGTTGNVTLTASAATFDALHVGSLWRLTHTLDGPTAAGTFTAAGTSSAISNTNQWKFITHGTWTAKLRIKQSDDGGSTWRVIRNYSGADDNNIIDSSTVDEGVLTQFVVECYSYTSGSVAYDLTGFPYVVDGIAQITAFSSSTSVSATVTSTIGSTATTTAWSEGSWSGKRGYPRANVFYENRLCFASTSYEPQTIWFSKPGDYDNFKTSIPTLDDDAVTAPLVARDVNIIRGLVALNDIIALTASAEWKISPGSASSAITPTNILAKPQGYRGSSQLDPLIVGNRVLYIQEMGSTVRDIGYQWQSDSYTGDDLTVLARHLFAGYTIVDWAYQQEPNSIIWAVRDDGVLLSFTYVKEHEVWGWAKHTTDGYFESVTTIPGDGRNEPWFVVRRTIGGNEVLYVEQMAGRLDTTLPKDQFFVDSGLTYEGAAADVISGLDHLEGETVAILADGNVMPQQAVVSGTITLPFEALCVQVGLPYIADFETLDVDFPSKDGSIQGRKKKISRATFRVEDSRGGWAGQSSDELYEIKWRADEVYGAPVALYSGDKNITLGGGYTDAGRVFFRQIDPLPVTLLAIISEVDFGGS